MSLIELDLIKYHDYTGPFPSRNYDFNVFLSIDDESHSGDNLRFTY